MNKTGTLGVASAPYWWSRVTTTAVRGAHHKLGHELAMWLLQVADDLAMITTHSRIRESVLIVLVFFRVMDFPPIMKKLARSDVRKWVGYELVLSNAALGLSSSRAGTRRSSESSLCRCKSFRSGWVGFVCGALDYDRPFLAPLYAFAARHAPNSVKPLPLCALVTVEYLRRKISQRRHCECGLSRASWSQAWRVDARADEEGAGVGGWWPQTNDRGLATTWDSLWFAVRSLQTTHPKLSRETEKHTGSSPPSNHWGCSWLSWPSARRKSGQHSPQGTGPSLHR